MFKIGAIYVVFLIIAFVRPQSTIPVTEAENLETTDFDYYDNEEHSDLKTATKYVEEEVGTLTVVAVTETVEEKLDFSETIAVNNTQDSDANKTDLALKGREVETTVSPSAITTTTTTTTSTTSPTTTTTRTTSTGTTSTTPKPPPTTTSRTTATSPPSTSKPPEDKSPLKAFNLQYLYFLLLLIPIGAIAVGVCCYCKKRRKKQGYVEPRISKGRRLSTTPSWVFSEPDFHDEEVVTQEKQ